MPKEKAPAKAPAFTIDASDPTFLGVLNHAAYLVSVNLDLTQTQRAEKVEALEALMEQGRTYQEEAGIRKPGLSKERNWEKP